MAVECGTKTRQGANKEEKAETAVGKVDADDSGGCW